MAKPRNPRGMSSTPLGELRQDPAFPDRRNLLDQKTYLFRESLACPVWKYLKKSCEGERFEVIRSSRFFCSRTKVFHDGRYSHS